MKGKRLVIGTETPARLDIHKIKQMTGGGDTMSGRGMRENFSQIKPTWKLLLQSNEFPQTSDPAFFERLNLVPFDCPIPKHEQRAGLKEYLRDEEVQSGILNWALAGLLQYHEQGLNPPERMAEAAANMRAEVDDVTRFLTDCFRLGATLKETSKAIHERYDWWCTHVENLPAGSRSRRSQKALGTALGALGFRKWQTGKERGWSGLALLDQALPVRGNVIDEEKIKAESDRIAEEDPAFKLS